jgi:hypothetical protein
MLKRNGIEPSPERSQRTSWSTFLKAHWKVLAAGDFLTVEVWTGRGLVTHYLLFVISLADRAVKIAGITTRSDEASEQECSQGRAPCEALLARQIAPRRSNCQSEGGIVRVVSGCYREEQSGMVLLSGVEPPTY